MLPDIPHYYANVQSVSFLVDLFLLGFAFAELMKEGADRAKLPKRYGAIIGFVLGASLTFAIHAAGATLLQHWLTGVIAALVCGTAAFLFAKEHWGKAWAIALGIFVGLSVIGLTNILEDPTLASLFALLALLGIIALIFFFVSTLAHTPPSPGPVIGHPAPQPTPTPPLPTPQPTPAPRPAPQPQPVPPQPTPPPRPVPPRRDPDQLPIVKDLRTLKELLHQDKDLFDQMRFALLRPPMNQEQFDRCHEQFRAIIDQETALAERMTRAYRNVVRPTEEVLRNKTPALQERMRNHGENLQGLFALVKEKNEQFGQDESNDIDRTEEVTRYVDRQLEQTRALALEIWSTQ